MVCACLNSVKASGSLPWLRSAKADARTAALRSGSAICVPTGGNVGNSGNSVATAVGRGAAAETFTAGVVGARLHPATATTVANERTQFRLMVKTLWCQ